LYLANNIENSLLTNMNYNNNIIERKAVIYNSDKIITKICKNTKLLCRFTGNSIQQILSNLIFIRNIHLTISLLLTSDPTRNTKYNK
jgi:hypothetical protein